MDSVVYACSLGAASAAGTPARDDGLEFHVSCQKLGPKSWELMKSSFAPSPHSLAGRTGPAGSGALAFAGGLYRCSGSKGELAYTNKPAGYANCVQVANYADTKAKPATEAGAPAMSSPTFAVESVKPAASGAATTANTGTVPPQWQYREGGANARQSRTEDRVAAGVARCGLQNQQKQRYYRVYEYPAGR